MSLSYLLFLIRSSLVCLMRLWLVYVLSYSSSSLSGNMTFLIATEGSTSSLLKVTLKTWFL